MLALTHSFATPAAARFACLLCGRDRFSRPSPHRCRGVGGFLKHFNRAARQRGLKTIWALVPTAKEAS